MGIKLATLNSKTVLVVDDQPSMLEAIADDFQDLGWTTVVAENGLEALKKFKETASIQLIVSDIRMPVWDGSKFLEELRKISPLDPPFIFVTGFTDIKNYDLMNLGADAILAKPINPEHLSSLLSSLMIPKDQRWLIRPDTIAKLNITNSPEKTTPQLLQFGRSGFFIAAELLDQPVVVGKKEMVTFEVDCPLIASKRLIGSGTIVWSRAQPQQDLIAGFGVEFCHLTGLARTEFMEAIQKWNMISTIPRGTILK